MSCTVVLQPSGLSIRCAPGTLLSEVIRRSGLSLPFVCGGIGACGRCRVGILAGNSDPPNPAEMHHLSAQDLALGQRLACQFHIRENTTVDVSFASCISSFDVPVTELQPVPAARAPAVRDFLVEPADCSNTDDIHALETSLGAALKRKYQFALSSIDDAVFSSLHAAFRSGTGRVRIGVRAYEVISIREEAEKPCGLAIDLGTTTICGYLADLESGTLLSARAIVNPQRSWGEDVMSRLAYVLREGDQAPREAVRRGLNLLIASLCGKPETIVDLILVGNTAMHHIFLGLPVRQLGVAPHRPADRAARDLKARELGLKVAPGAYVHLLPPVGGFVGSDHVAVLLAAELDNTHRTVLVLDIGTNTEAALVKGETIRSISCASGPAFEGGHLTHGTWATPGAIDAVHIGSKGITCTTIGGMRPHGICGSGILDALAVLVHLKVIDGKGRLAAGGNTVSSPTGTEFILVPGEQTATGSPITISQQDVREVQLAKAAVRAGIDILLNEAGISWEAIDEVILTGGFGAKLNPASAIGIGMLPPFASDRVKTTAHGAGMGALRCLLSTAERGRAAELSRRIHHLELMNHAVFKKCFAHAMYFPV